MSQQVQEWIADLDSGKRVKSVSMGGLGKGYELAIQNCAVETLRGIAGKEVPEELDEYKSMIRAASDEAVSKLDKAHGFSGAQVGVANNIVSVFWRQSPTKGIEMMEKQDPARIIELWLNPLGVLDCTVPEEE